MKARWDIAIVGAAGLRASTLLEALDERPRRFGRKHLLAHPHQAGLVVDEALSDHPPEPCETFDFSGVPLAFFLVDDPETRQRALAAGCRIIDGSGRCPAATDTVVVLEPGEAPSVAQREQRVWLSPSATVVALTAVLRPLQAAAPLETLTVASLQAVSGGGAAALEELGRQSAALLSFQPVRVEHHPAQIAFNLLPAVGPLGADGRSAAEREILAGLSALLSPAPMIRLTTVQVPVFYGDLQLVSLQAGALDAAAARRLWQGRQGLKLMVESLPTPVGEASGRDEIVIGRLRDEAGVGSGFSFCVLADNMRRAGVDNAVRMAECLVADN